MKTILSVILSFLAVFAINVLIDFVTGEEINILHSIVHSVIFCAFYYAVNYYLYLRKKKADKEEKKEDA